MASLQKRGNCWSLQWDGRDKRMKTLSLGPVSKRAAETMKGHVESLISAHLTGTAPAPATSRWLADVGDKLYEKLAARELVQGRQSALLGPFIDDLLAEREADPAFKPRTVASYRPTFASLREHFGDNRPLRAVTHKDARLWRLKIAVGKRENTVRKWTAKAKSLFGQALRDGLIDASPFDGLASHTVATREQHYFISRKDAGKILAACPSLEWRLIFALSRYGGLRCPSEIRELKWGDIQWDNNRFVVHCVKTEHHEGHDIRFTPIFPELRPLLEQAYEQAEEGAVYVVPRCQPENYSPRTTLRKIIVRAGVQPWPRLTNNLRSTRATELKEKYPGHVVDAWLGHTEETSRMHYLQVTDEHFERAATDDQTAEYLLRNPAASGGTVQQSVTGTA